MERIAPSRRSPPSGAVGRAVELALKDVRAVQGRATEDLRVEDAIRDLSLHGREVHVSVVLPNGIRRDDVRDLVKGLLQKHGAAGVRVELHQPADTKAAVKSANQALEAIHGRRTRDVRVEDGVASLAAREDGKIAVLLKPNQPYDEGRIADAVHRLLKDAGVKAPALAFVRPAVEAFLPAKLVADANASLDKVRQRHSTDLRAEDDIVNLHWSGHSVRIILSARPNHSDALIVEAARNHLDRAGLRGAKVEVVRPAVDPMRPPVAHLLATQVPGNALAVRLQAQLKPEIGANEPPVGLPADRQFAAGMTRASLAMLNAAANERVVELEEQGTGTRLSAANRARILLEALLIKTALGGEPGIVRRLAEIDQALLSGTLYPDTEAALRMEHEALKETRELYVPLRARIADIEKVELAGTLDPTLALTYGVEKKGLAAFCDGLDVLRASIRENERALTASALAPELERRLTLEVNVLKAVEQGSAGCETRLWQLAKLRREGSLTPAELENCLIEEKALASIARELNANAH